MLAMTAALLIIHLKCVSNFLYSTGGLPTRSPSQRAWVR